MKYTRRVEYINEGVDAIDHVSDDWSRDELEDVMRTAVIMLHEERASSNKEQRI